MFLWDVVQVNRFSKSQLPSLREKNNTIYFLKVYWINDITIHVKFVTQKDQLFRNCFLNRWQRFLTWKKICRIKETPSKHTIDLATRSTKKKEKRKRRDYSELFFHLLMQRTMDSLPANQLLGEVSKKHCSNMRELCVPGLNIWDITMCEMKNYLYRTALFSAVPAIHLSGALRYLYSQISTRRTWPLNTQGFSLKEGMHNLLSSQKAESHSG